MLVPIWVRLIILGTRSHQRCSNIILTQKNLLRKAGQVFSPQQIDEKAQEVEGIIDSIVYRWRTTAEALTLCFQGP